MEKIRSLTIIYFSLLVSLPWQLCAQEPDLDLDLSSLILPLSENGIFRDPDYYNWGASIIKGEDEKYHMFYSRWKREHTFAGWLTFSEIAHATADRPTGPWKYMETVLQGRGSGHWDAITAHNPKIKYFDGKYYLYYIATNFGGKDYTDQLLSATHDKSLEDANRRLLRENQRTGVAVASSIDGPWKRMDEPLLEPKGPIQTLTVNPAIDHGKDGNYFLIVKGDKPNASGFVRNQAIAVSKSPEGPFTIQNRPVIDNLDTEDVSMWYSREKDIFYAVFHAHTFIGLMYSKDGLIWEKALHYKVMDKAILKEDGTVLLPDRMERPFVYVEDGLPKALALAIKKGEDSYTVFLPLKDRQ